MAVKTIKNGMLSVVSFFDTVINLSRFTMTRTINYPYRPLKVIEIKKETRTENTLG